MEFARPFGTAAWWRGGVRVPRRPDGGLPLKIKNRATTATVAAGGGVSAPNGVGASVSSARPTSAKYDFAPAAEKIKSWVKKGVYPGASLLVVRNNKVIYWRYFGRYRPDTVVYIASSGKWLAAATIAALVDEGKLAWNDRVSKWLPQFTGTKGRPTLCQLFSHTAGFEPYQPPGNHPDDYQTLAESITHIVPLPMRHKPGTHFEYGGLAMQVAARMAELAGGKDWETLFQDRIARPLQMVETHFTPVDPTHGHTPMVGGGARSTLGDYANFLAMIYNDGVFAGRRILSTATIQQMQADQVGRAVVSPDAFALLAAHGKKFNGLYGLGEWREVLNAKKEAVWISSPSWAGTYPWIDKTRHLYGVFLTHVDVKVADPIGFNSWLSGEELARLVNQAIDRPVK